jgi:hypothetical protein
LIQSVESVKYFEMYAEEWLKPLDASVGQYPNAGQILEIRFKDGSTHKYDGRFRKPSSNLIFFVRSNNEIDLMEDRK